MRSALHADTIGYLREKRTDSEQATQTRSGMSTSVRYANQTQTSSALTPIKPLSYEEYYCFYESETPSNSPGPFDNDFTLVSDFDGLTGSDKDQCLSLQKANYSSWAATATYPSYSDIYWRAPDVWRPFKAPPCCNTYCKLDILEAQMIFWSTPAPQPIITTLVSDGFTL